MPDTATLVQRRLRLSRRFDGPALFAAGRAPSRNYPDNVYPFRASSHFLYFAGRPLEGAALLFDGERWLLLAEPPDADDALWHGPSPSLDDLQRALGVDEVRPLSEAPALVAASGEPVATLAPQDATTRAWLAELLGRPLAESDD